MSSSAEHKTSHSLFTKAPVPPQAFVNHKPSIFFISTSLSTFSLNQVTMRYFLALALAMATAVIAAPAPQSGREINKRQDIDWAWCVLSTANWDTCCAEYPDQCEGSPFPICIEDDNGDEICP
ncbi:uncharacterized protein LY89DRAFT_683501 [Mollisia scopiformis]|uniref:Uncharacterized protein n=1 Tax=Mollisia scopiformis TaxID=149040 RepID=A0A194XEF2_MOLSC|nr:uncharacterized protein LY89DRAFT_683501 [Mollisia scopiformis]KUJ18553.1 hypothetical protein LY89DRAFT_683501 [Mollisia scopiformis]